MWLILHQTFNDMAKNINRKVTIYINGKEVENTLKGMKPEEFVSAAGVSMETLDADYFFGK